MQHAALTHTQGVEEVVSIADACLGGLHGRSALLIGPEEQRQPYRQLLQQAGMKHIYQEDTLLHASTTIPHVQLLISMPSPSSPVPVITAAAIAQGCIGRRTPLLIFDLSQAEPSVEELAGLLPAVCLYTPEDLRRIFAKLPN
jgi:glutamyl-tRNA reductase